MNTKPELPELNEVLELISSTPEVTAAQAARIAEKNASFDGDAAFLGDLQKARVASGLRRALEKKGESISSFAVRWNKTKQYVSRILNLDQKTNFTIETITQAATLLDLRVTVQIHRPDQEVVVRRRRALSSEYQTKARALGTAPCGKFKSDGYSNNADPLAA